MNADLLSRTDAVFSAWDRPDTPGCALGIVRDGELVFFRGYGRANLDYGLPITSQTVFDIASTSKQFTAACIALLAEQGKLSLDDEVRSYMPELPQFGATITVAHLIHHTSGWRDYLTLMEFAGYRDQDYISVPEVMTLLQRQRALNFTPGDAYQYSNTGYLLLGQLVERLSEKTLAEFAEAHILGPLGMVHSHFQDDQTRVVPNRASGYTPNEAGCFQLLMSTLDMVGDGGLMTCVDDLVLWDRNYYDNQLGQGGPGLIQQMTTPATLNDGSAGTYGFGLELTPMLGLRCVSHAGWWAGYRAELLRFPEQSFSVICLANTDNLNPTALSLRVAALWLGDAVAAPFPDAKDPAANQTTVHEANPTYLAGLYHTAEKDRYVIVREQDGALSANFGGQDRPLTPTGDGRWLSDASLYLLELNFVDDSLHVMADGVAYGVFKRVIALAQPPLPLDDYAGSFHSDELDTTYLIVVDGDGLAVRVPRHEPTPLRHVHEHAFQMTDRTLRFESDGVGLPAAFVMSSPRAQGIRFERMRASRS